MKWMPILGTCMAVRFDALNERQAMRNHGQTLDRLAERGGLGPDEAAAILEIRRGWIQLGAALKAHRVETSDAALVARKLAGVD